MPRWEPHTFYNPKKDLKALHLGTYPLHLYETARGSSHEALFFYSMGIPSYTSCPRPTKNPNLTQFFLYLGIHDLKLRSRRSRDCLSMLTTTLQCLLTQQPLLIILFSYFEVALRVIANGADLRRLRAYYDMTAVSAFPDLDLALFKYLRCLQMLLQQCAVSFFVVLFDLANGSEALAASSGKPSSSAVLAKSCRTYRSIRSFRLLLLQPGWPWCHRYQPVP